MTILQIAPVWQKFFSLYFFFLAVYFGTYFVCLLFLFLGLGVFGGGGLGNQLDDAKVIFAE